MALFHSPKTSTDGLVFMYDTGNKKSYPGEPTTNLAGSIVKRFTNWNGLTGTTEYYTTSTGDQGVKLVTTASGGVQWYSFSTIYNIQASTEYTISATVKYTGGTPHPNLLYVRQYDGNGQTSESGKFSTSYERDLGNGWKRIWRTFTTDSTTTHINLQGYEYTTGKTIYIQDVQFELKSHATPFAGISTTRSATQGLIDRTGNSTIDLSDVSFDSNAQMTFDGTDDRMYTSETYDLGNSFTFEFVMKPNTLKNYGDPLGASLTNTGDYGMTFVTYADGHMAFNLGNGSNGWSSTAISTSTGYLTNGTYYHITGVCELGILKLYKNGVLTHSGTTPYAFNDYSINIGNRTRTSLFYPFNGNVYMVKAYNRALTAAEILKNFNAIRSRFGL